MERAYFTVVPLTAVLRSISLAKEKMCLVLYPSVDFKCVMEAMVRVSTSQKRRFQTS